MKAALFLVVTMALLPVSTTEAHPRTEPATSHASVTVFDMFELSPERFATLLAQSGE